ncbi:MAG: hypothetical protein RR549_03135 [Oscillospiraceae bacterium]
MIKRKMVNKTLCKNSNLPQNKVTHIICPDEPKIINSFLKINIVPVVFKPNMFLKKEEASHADMNFCNIESNFFINNSDLKNRLFDYNVYNAYIFENTYNSMVKYPESACLNVCVLNDYIICNEKYIDYNVLNKAKEFKKKVINVNQGYCKCSICVVDETSIITEDISIYEKCKEHLDCLLIKKGHILLEGYDYGFIGGATFKTDKNNLFFCGNINQHPDYLKIKNFCQSRGVNINNLFINDVNFKLTDYGSPMPLFEEI